MRNKKGILVKNALGAIIAIMGLVILIFAGMNIYKSFYEEKRNAQKVIDNIMGKIDNLEEGENGTFLIQGIDDWSLKGWSKDEENRPDKCFFDSCLCICPNEGPCPENGLCRKIDQGKFLIPETFLSLEWSIEVSSSLENKLHEIFIFKGNDLLIVFPEDISNHAFSAVDFPPDYNLEFPWEEIFPEIETKFQLP
ncbi:TPA: hypothetical protein EYQ19_02045 [Candidatus Pacearchaeota archaeon]|nr:hypothetical protein [Candidatus Pacearchaeota archaeon]